MLGNSSQCYDCHPECATCEGKANQCTSCKLDGKGSPSKLLDKQINFCVEECTQGSYLSKEDPHTCYPCAENCAECEGSSNICTRCSYDPTRLVELFLIDGQCLEDCPAGTKSDLSSHTCKPSYVSDLLSSN